MGGNLHSRSYDGRGEDGELGWVQDRGGEVREEDVGRRRRGVGARRREREGKRESWGWDSVRFEEGGRGVCTDLRTYFYIFLLNAFYD